MTADTAPPPPPATPADVTPADVTLGILAGGRASRLGGLDKAWLHRDGRSQIESIIAELTPLVGAVLVSANRNAERYRALALDVVADAHPDCGPVGGLHALAHACATPWLLTVPVDALRLAPAAVRALIAHAPAFAEDDDGLQPLFACWPARRLTMAAAQAIADGRLPVRGLHAALGMRAVAISGTIGNLNTADDLAAAGVRPDARRP